MMRVLRYVGSAVALIFVGIVLWQGAGSMPAIDLTAATAWVGLLGCFILYCTSQFIGAAAWKSVLAIYDVNLPKGTAASQLLVSQIGKYIPGNVAHLFGRVALARTDGVAAKVTGVAMLLEVGLLLTTGLLTIGLMLVISPDLLGRLTEGLPDKTTAVLIAVAVVVVLVGLIVGQVIIWRRAGRPTPRFYSFLVPIAWHGANFLLLGVSLWCAALVVVPDHSATLLNCTAIFATAWVAGFLMPGAPGGVGIRDGIIALGIGLFLGQGAGLGVAVVHRMMSVLGDVTIFGIGLWLRKGRPG